MDKATWDAVKQYYTQLLQMQADEQQDFITELEAYEPEVASFLRSLIENESDSFHSFDSPAISKIRDSEEQKPTDLIGAQIGKYKLTFLIGIGGMGRVYLADRTDLEAHQQVAIKIISTGFLSDIYTKRFDRERKILSRLNHPHITRIYDGGIAETGTPFIVMEYVEGKPLLEYVKDQNLSLAGRLELFLDLCSAVAYAHQNFIMHRDLKPGNILVTNHGIVKVIDFGIAKILEDDAAEDDLTIMGYIPLTPAYASPEQLKGQPLTMGSDIYSLGVILYELVTGKKPFPGSSKSSVALTERLNHTSPPAKPSTQLDPAIATDPKTWQKALTGDIDNIILKALKEHPNERYGSADQLAEDIRRHQNNYPVKARPESLGYRFKKYVKRNRALVSLGVALLIILVSGIAATMWQARAAAMQRDQAQYEAAKAKQITQFLTNLFDHSDPDRSKGDVLTSENMLAHGSERLEELADQPALQAEMYRMIGDLYRKQNFFPEAEKHLLKALDIFEEVNGAQDIEVAKTKLLLGDLYAFMNNTEQVLVMSQEAADIFAEKLGKQSVEYIKATSYVGRGKNQSGDYKGALESLLELSPTLESWREPTEEQSIAKASVYNDIASSYNAMDKPEQYTRYILKALEEMIRAKGELNQNVAALYINLGHSYYFESQYDSAEHYSRKALRIANQVYSGKPNDRSQASHCDLAKIYIEVGKLSAALEHAEQCYSMALEVYGDGHFNTARGLGVLGDVYIAMEDYANADKYRFQATRMFEEFYGGPNPMLVWQYWDEADRYYRMGDLKKAIEYKRKCLDMYAQTMPDATADIADAKRILAWYLMAVDSLDKAVPVLEASVEAHVEALGREDETTQSVMRELIELYEQVERPDQARALRVQLTPKENRADPQEQS